MSASPGQPDGRGTFSLEGRPAAGLYLIAWLLSGIGLGLLLVALFASGGIAGLLFVGALALLGIGLSAAAGYQVVARAERGEMGYRGPSVLVLFGLQLLLSTVLGGLLVLVGLPDPRASPIAFAVVGTTLLLSYLVIVSVFVVRTGALSWRDMRWPIGLPFRRILADAGYGALTMVVLWIPITLLAGLLAALLGTQTADVVPIPVGATDLVLTILAAAVLVPIGEELFFRGFALTAWLRERGARSALIRSTAFFALVHSLNIEVSLEPGAALDGARQALFTVIVIAPVGLALGWLFLRRGLTASIAGHSMFNLIGVLVLSLVQNLPTPRG